MEQMHRREISSMRWQTPFWLGFTRFTSYIYLYQTSTNYHQEWTLVAYLWLKSHQSQPLKSSQPTCCLMRLSNTGKTPRHSYTILNVAHAYNIRQDGQGRTNTNQTILWCVVRQLTNLSPRQLHICPLTASFENYIWTSDSPTTIKIYAESPCPIANYGATSQTNTIDKEGLSNILSIDRATFIPGTKYTLQSSRRYLTHHAIAHLLIQRPMQGERGGI